MGERAKKRISPRQFFVMVFIVCTAGLFALAPLMMNLLLPVLRSLMDAAGFDSVPLNSYRLLEPRNVVLMLALSTACSYFVWLVLKPKAD